MAESDETLPQDDSPILKAIAELAQKIDDYKKDTDAQFEAIRRGIAENSARFDQLEALALEAKSIALVTRSQLTILTEEVRQSRKSLV